MWHELLWTKVHFGDLKEWALAHNSLLGAIKLLVFKVIADVLAFWLEQTNLMQSHWILIILRSMALDCSNSVHNCTVIWLPLYNVSF